MNLSISVALLRSISLSLVATFACLSLPVHAQVPSINTNPNSQQPIDPNDPNVLRPSAQNTGVLSIDGGKRLMSDAESAANSRQYDVAVKKLQEARTIFNQLSNFYQELNSSFAGIDNKVADVQRKKALETAQMRDEATFRLALVHRAQSKDELAIPLLVQIIKSQNPTRDLGKKAYQQLLELGFIDAPAPRNTPQNPK
jgi:hypothetical protein